MLLIDQSNACFNKYIFHFTLVYLTCGLRLGMLTRCSQQEVSTMNETEEHFTKHEQLMYFKREEEHQK